MEISEKDDDSLQHLLFIVEKIYKKGNVAYIQHMWDNYVCTKCVPADTDLDHDFNCFKCSA